MFPFCCHFISDPQARALQEEFLRLQQQFLTLQLQATSKVVQQVEPEIGSVSQPSSLLQEVKHESIESVEILPEDQQPKRYTHNSV